MSYSYKEGEVTPDGTWACNLYSLTETGTSHSNRTVIYGGPGSNPGSLTRDQASTVDFGVTYRANADTDGALVKVNAVRLKVYYIIDPSQVSPPTKARSGLTGVAMAGDTIVAGGENGRVIRSTDRGSTWSEVSVPFTSDVFSVRYLNGNFIITGKQGLFALSTDLGATWTVYSLGTQEHLYDCSYSPNMGYVACGSNDTAVYSADGLTWRDASSQVLT